jgi:capsular polysaccharide biosynthesis protein
VQLELRDYLNVLIKRWWLILLVAVGALIAGYGYTLTQPSLYQASVTLQVVPSRNDNGLIEFASKNINTYTTFLTSRDFVTGVLTANGGEVDGVTPDQVLARLKVQALPDKLQVLMTVDDTDPKRAAALANDLADAYVLQEAGLEQKKISEDKVFLQKVDTARQPDRPYQPRPLLTAGAAGLLGLVLGLILAFALEFTDTTLKTADDVQRYLALTTVGLIPARKP